jgi:hypothetical protein
MARVELSDGGPSHARRRRVRVLVVLALVFCATVGFAAVRAHQAFRAYQQLSAPGRGPSGPGGAGADERIRDFVPLSAVARRVRVPETVLEDALRSAGFTLEPQEIAPDFPRLPNLLERLHRWLRPPPPQPTAPPGPAGTPVRPPAASPSPERRVTPRRPDGLLDPDQQSLRQIAHVSGRQPAEAVRVVQDAIRTYRETAPGERP